MLAIGYGFVHRGENLRLPPHLCITRTDGVYVVAARSVITGAVTEGFIEYVRNKSMRNGIFTALLLPMMDELAASLKYKAEWIIYCSRTFPTSDLSDEESETEDDRDMEHTTDHKAVEVSRRLVTMYTLANDKYHWF